MNALPKLVIKDRRIYLDGIRLRCVKAYSLAGRMDRGTSCTELTVTMLVDSKFHVATDGDAVSTEQEKDNREAWASTFGVRHPTLTHHDGLPPEPRTINAKPPSPDGITFSE